MSWKQLRKMGQAFPAMARLENGNYVIIVGLRQTEGEEGDRPRKRWRCFDPLADQQGFIFSQAGASLRNPGKVSYCSPSESIPCSTETSRSV
jgi:hypothetical protein